MTNTPVPQSADRVPTREAVDELAKQLVNLANSTGHGSSEDNPYTLSERLLLNVGGTLRSLNSEIYRQQVGNVIGNAELQSLYDERTALLAEVERLNGDLAFEKRDREMADVAAAELRTRVDQLEREVEAGERNDRDAVDTIHVADQKIAQLEAQNEGLRKDAERLNWLAENVWMWTPPKVDAPYAKVEIWLDAERKFQVGWHDSVGVASLRTAIDAAAALSQPTTPTATPGAGQADGEGGA